jgi:hypothetical protein
LTKVRSRLYDEFVVRKLLLLTAPFCLARPSFAQNARLAGRVTAGPAPVQAVVTVTQPASGWSRQILCSSRGSFSLAQLPAGGYRVTASGPGFRPSEPASFYVRAGDSLVLDLRLSSDPAPRVLAFDAGSVAALLAAADFSLF